MNSTNTISYLQNRQLGYNGFRKNVYDMLLSQLCYLRPSNYSDDGNTFSCKFCKNKNYLHLVASSTEIGSIIIKNTEGDPDKYTKTGSNVHRNAIFDLSWSEPNVKLVTACGDQTSKILNVRPDGQVCDERSFTHHSAVKSVMFSPGSSDVFCTGTSEGSVFIWDARINNDRNVINFDCEIPNTHGLRASSGKRPTFGVSCVVFRNNQTVISSAFLDSDIKEWDLRKSYCKIKHNKEPLSLRKFHHGEKLTRRYIDGIGFNNLIMNPQCTLLYASTTNLTSTQATTIYCYALDSTDSMPFCKYTGYQHETNFSRISISNDGRYLFSGCVDKCGVLWITDFPYKEKPEFEMSQCTPDCHNIRELSSSDWCLDTSCMKLATCSDSDIMIWNVHPDYYHADCEMEAIKSETYRSRSFSKQIHTVPIKFKSIEVKEKCMKETEIDLENWDTDSQINLEELKKCPKICKTPWNILFEGNKKNNSPSPMEKTSTSFKSNSIDNSALVSKKKRKKSSSSSRGLIDFYFPSNTKREKLDIDTEEKYKHNYDKDF